MPEEKSKELRFKRVIYQDIFELIPRKLFAQVEGITDRQIDNLIIYGRHILNSIEIKNGELRLVPNKLVRVDVLLDEGNRIHGLLWVEFDVVEELIFVQIASVEKAYQKDFKQRMVQHLFAIKVGDACKPCKQRIRMATSRPRAYERDGWKRSKMTIMEIENVGPTDPQEIDPTEC